MPRHRRPSATKPVRSPSHRPYPRSRIAQAVRSGLLFSANAMALSLDSATSALGSHQQPDGVLYCTSRMLGVDWPVLWQLHQAHGLDGQLCTAEKTGLMVGYLGGPQFAVDVQNYSLAGTALQLPHEEQVLESLVDSGDMPALQLACSVFAEHASDLDQYLVLVHQTPLSSLLCAISIQPIVLDWMNPYENIGSSRPWFNGRTLIVQRQDMRLLKDIGHGRD